MLQLQFQQEQLQKIVLAQGKLLQLQQLELARQQEELQQQLHQQTLQRSHHEPQPLQLRHQQPQVQQNSLVPREWQTEQQQIIVSPEVVSGNGTPGIYSANSAEGNYFI